MIIDGVTYGTGTASSKKLAKNKAGNFLLHHFVLCSIGWLLFCTEVSINQLGPGQFLRHPP